MPEPSSDRILQFETPPPVTPPPVTPQRVEVAPPPAGVPSWASRVIDTAPLLLVMALALVVLVRRRWRRRLLRILAVLAIALLVGGAVFYGTYLLGCRLMKCVDAAGLVPILAGLVVGTIAGIVTLGLAWKRSARHVGGD